MNGARHIERRINNSLPVAREGLPFIFGSLLLTCAFFLAGPLFLVIPASVVTLFIICFFRDPDRENHGGDRAVLTPADGKVIKVEHLQGHNNPLGEPAIKVSIFMSLLDVHVNRIPVSGRILEVKYKPGRFFSANLDKASEENEHNQVTLETGGGHRVVFVQIAGLIARRIVCWIRTGDVVSAGQRCGLIRFGSRLDVYVPAESHLTVKVRDRVRAGETILGYLP
ncbi:MAG: phosphatidylserine decarboxylase family protein [Deltaproteobacteria bacterium]|nr:phosphatidylserine decarboxylase family protein [Deltaproteobacteria bacterium]